MSAAGSTAGAVTLAILLLLCGMLGVTALLSQLPKDGRLIQWQRQDRALVSLLRLAVFARAKVVYLKFEPGPTYERLHQKPVKRPNLQYHTASRQDPRLSALAREVPRGPTRQRRVAPKLEPTLLSMANHGAAVT